MGYILATSSLWFSRWECRPQVLAGVVWRTVYVHFADLASSLGEKAKQISLRWITVDSWLHTFIIFIVCMTCVRKIDNNDRYSKRYKIINLQGLNSSNKNLLTNKCSITEEKLMKLRRKRGKETSQ